MSITAKSKKTQCQRLVAYLRKHRRGITTMEAFEHLRITCLHKRIAELEQEKELFTHSPWFRKIHTITRTREVTPFGSTVTRYKLAR
jgi:hypothetical protein